MPVRPIPEGYHTVTPYLIAKGSAKLMDFLKAAFGAKEIERLATPDGTLMHGEVRIGDSVIMLGDSKGGDWTTMPTCIYLYVPDCDATFRQAVAAGATAQSQPADQFYGDRCGNVKDPFGNIWCIATHKEDVSIEEIKRRAATMKK
jgi:PhnB protein